MSEVFQGEISLTYVCKDDLINALSTFFSTFDIANTICPSVQNRGCSFFKFLRKTFSLNEQQKEQKLYFIKCVNFNWSQTDKDDHFDLYCCKYMYLEIPDKQL